MILLYDLYNYFIRNLLFDPNTLYNNKINWIEMNLRKRFVERQVDWNAKEGTSECGQYVLCSCVKLQDENVL